MILQQDLKNATLIFKIFLYSIILLTNQVTLYDKLILI